MLRHLKKMANTLFLLCALLPGCKQAPDESAVKFIKQWGGHGAAPGNFDQPVGIALDADGHIYVADTGNNRIQKFSPEGAFLLEWGKSVPTLRDENGLQRPMHLAVSAAGLVYVPEYGNDRIHVFDASGNSKHTFGQTGDAQGEFDAPASIHFDRKGHVLVSDFFNHRIQIFDQKGKFLSEIGGEGHAPGQLYYPTNIAVDQDRHIFVADAYNHRIQKFDAAGNFIQSWASREIYRRSLTS